MISNIGSHIGCYQSPIGCYQNDSNLIPRLKDFHFTLFLSLGSRAKLPAPFSIPQIGARTQSKKSLNFFGRDTRWVTMQRKLGVYQILA